MDSRFCIVPVHRVRQFTFVNETLISGPCLPRVLNMFTPATDFVVIDDTLAASSGLRLATGHRFVKLSWPIWQAVAEASRDVPGDWLVRIIHQGGR